MHLENLALLSILLYSAHYATTLFIHRSHRRWPRIHKPGDYVAEEIDTGKKQILRGIITAYKTHKENKVFVLRCPSPTSEHWINKIRYTVEWRRNNVSVVTLEKLPREGLLYDVTNKLDDGRDFTSNLTSKNVSNFFNLPSLNSLRVRLRPELNVRQWPTIDGRFANAIVVLRWLLDDKPLSENSYKFEAEERRRWFAMRIRHRKSHNWLHSGLWSCHMTFQISSAKDGKSGNKNEENTCQTVRLESRKLLKSSSTNYHDHDEGMESLLTNIQKPRRQASDNVEDPELPKPYIGRVYSPTEQNNTGGRDEKVHRNIEENFIKDLVQSVRMNHDENRGSFTFSKSDGESRTFRRWSRVNEVAFIRGSDEVEYTRDTDSIMFDDAKHKSSEKTAYNSFALDSDSPSETGLIPKSHELTSEVEPFIRVSGGENINNWKLKWRYELEPQLYRSIAIASSINHKFIKALMTLWSVQFLK